MNPLPCELTAKTPPSFVFSQHCDLDDVFFFSIFFGFSFLVGIFYPRDPGSPNVRG